jgi:hypothetical protein
MLIVEWKPMRISDLQEVLNLLVVYVVNKIVHLYMCCYF